MQIIAITVKVFVNESNNFGNPVGIILDENKAISHDRRLEIAQKLQFSETVFINSLHKLEVSIFNSQNEIKFAGHALLGTAWYIKEILKKNYQQITTSKGGACHISIRNNALWLTANNRTFPPWNYLQLENDTEVESIPAIRQKDLQHTYVWAWSSVKKEEIRARTFASDWGIPEDEANGSGSMKLALNLKRQLKIRHGKGSVILANYITDEIAEVCGRMILAKSTII